MNIVTERLQGRNRTYRGFLSGRIAGHDLILLHVCACVSACDCLRDVSLFDCVCVRVERGVREWEFEYQILVFVHALSVSLLATADQLISEQNMHTLQPYVKVQINHLKNHSSVQSLTHDTRIIWKFRSRFLHAHKKKARKQLCQVSSAKKINGWQLYYDKPEVQRKKIRSFSHKKLVVFLRASFAGLVPDVRLPQRPRGFGLGGHVCGVFLRQ